MSVIGVVAAAFTQSLLAGDFVLVDTVEVHGDSLLIGANCLGMVGTISGERGQYIQQGLDGVFGERPNVYDVFRDVTENFDIQVEEVKITRIVDNHFLSVVTFSSENKILEADARPSDGIALALRTGSPIYFNKTFLEANGADICPDDN